MSLKTAWVSVDLYAFGPHAELPSLSYLSTFTGGNVFFRERFDSQGDNNEFYNTLVNNLTRYHGTLCTIRGRVNSEFTFKRIISKFGIGETIYASIPWVTTDDYMIFEFSLDHKKKEKPFGYAQFVFIYDTTDCHRYIRIFNFRYQFVQEPRSHYFTLDELYGSLNFNGLWTFLLRSTFDQLRTVPMSQLRDNFINVLKNIMVEFRKNEYNHSYTSSKELTVPRKIESILMMAHSLLREAVMKPVVPGEKERDKLLYSYLHLSSLSPQLLFCYLYPRVFDLTTFDDYDSSCYVSLQSLNSAWLPERARHHYPPGQFATHSRGIRGVQRSLPRRRG